MYPERNIASARLFLHQQAVLVTTAFKLQDLARERVLKECLQAFPLTEQ